jgi:hypothetical protein
MGEQEMSTRPLTADERGVLEKILGAAPEHARDVLLSQLDFVSVETSSIATWTDLTVAPGAIPVSNIVSPIDVGAEVVGTGEEPLGGIVVFLDANGYLSAIDYFWFGDERPEAFPTPDQLQIRPEWAS